MDISKWSGIAVALIAAGGAVFQSRRRPDPRARIKADLDILEKLPSSTTQAQDLQRHIDSQIEQLIDAEARRQRDWQGVGVAAFLLIVAGAVGYLADQTHGWFVWPIYLLSGITGLMGIVGFCLSIGKTHRDAKGNRVSESSA